MAELPDGVAARAHRALDSLHAMVYFAAEAEEELTGVGLRPGRMCYFASRSAAMGPVSAGVTVATFYNFNPALVARSIPRAWALASIDDILAARLRAADRALRRMLGEEAVASAEVAEVARLASTAATGLRPHGRPLYAAHAELPWPDEPHLVLWHASTLLREHRGDGHVAALLVGGISGLDALITHTATGRGFLPAAARATRGWSEDEWAAAENGLRERGLLDGTALTAAGEQLRAAVEADTDRLAAQPWLQLGEAGTTRLTALGKQLTRAVLAAGAFPADMFAAPRG